MLTRWKNQELSGMAWGCLSLFKFTLLFSSLRYAGTFSVFEFPRHQRVPRVLEDGGRRYGKVTATTQAAGELWYGAFSPLRLRGRPVSLHGVTGTFMLVCVALPTFLLGTVFSLESSACFPFMMVVNPARRGAYFSMSSFLRDKSPQAAFRDEVSGHRFYSSAVETFLDCGGPSGHCGTFLTAGSSASWIATATMSSRHRASTAIDYTLDRDGCASHHGVQSLLRSMEYILDRGSPRGHHGNCSLARSEQSGSRRQLVAPRPTFRCS